MCIQKQRQENLKKRSHNYVPPKDEDNSGSATPASKKPRKSGAGFEGKSGSFINKKN